MHFDLVIGECSVVKEHKVFRSDSSPYRQGDGYLIRNHNIEHYLLLLSYTRNVGSGIHVGCRVISKGGGDRNKALRLEDFKIRGLYISHSTRRKTSHSSDSQGRYHIIPSTFSRG